MCYILLHFCYIILLTHQYRQIADLTPSTASTAILAPGHCAATARADAQRATWSENGWSQNDLAFTVGVYDCCRSLVYPIVTT
jgi:hypothetical protein